MLLDLSASRSAASRLEVLRFARSFGPASLIFATPEEASLTTGFRASADFVEATFDSAGGVHDAAAVH